MVKLLLSKSLFRQTAIARISHAPVLKHSSAKTKTQIDDSCESPKSDKQNTKARETSHILLVMADKLFSDYLKKTLSRYFQISSLIIRSC